MKDNVPEEGDIFRWRWTPEEYERRQKDCGSTVYWCKSQIAICNDGVLRDTFWGSSGDNYRLDLDRVQITFLGNPANMKRIGGDDRVFYKPDDVVDTSHPNDRSAPVYVKGERDPATMRDYYENQAERFKRESRWALDRVEDCNAAIAMIDRGDLNDNSFSIYR
jgi:hypothetical protein